VNNFVVICEKAHGCRQAQAGCVLGHPHPVSKHLRGYGQVPCILHIARKVRFKSLPFVIVQDEQELP